MLETWIDNGVVKAIGDVNGDGRSFGDVVTGDFNGNGKIGIAGTITAGTSQGIVLFAHR